MPALVKKPSAGKASCFGIEVTERLVWEGWEPGREYTKNIVLKNLKIKSEKVTFSKPNSRFFNTIYPQPALLTQGTSFSLPVTFRPLEKIEYRDAIQFTTSEGRFSIPIFALLPKFSIQTKRWVDFGMCAVHHYSQSSFEISNCSELVTPFKVECLDPFCVEPSEGTLGPFESTSISCVFRPTAALVYEAVAAVLYGKDLDQGVKIKFTGIGKFPHILVNAQKEHGRPDNEKVVEFGVSAVGETIQRWVEIENLAQVDTPYTITHPAGSHRLDCVFRCAQTKGMIAAGCTVKIPIVFRPNTVGVRSIDYFHVKAIGDLSQSVICCQGSSRGPRVGLSDNILNFKVINEGEVATRTIDIINDTDIPATFQFVIDCHESVFKLDTICGTLPEHSKKTMIVQFQPAIAMNYYRRVTCLVHNQGPLFLDMIGTCHAELVKPAVLQPKHLYQYDIHKQRSLTYIAPDVLNEMLSENQLAQDDEGYLYDPNSGSQEFTSVIANVPAMDQYFNDGHHSEFMHEQPHVSLDANCILFGQCPTIQHIEDKSVVITNHTHGKVAVAWMCGNDRVFSVSPANMDILPQKSAVFTISFRPNGPNQYFGAELECYVYYKSLRDYRLVEDLTHFPPWCLTLNCFGQTFHPSAETFLPRYTIDSEETLFMPVTVNESTYRTIRLSNHGKTPLYYDIDCPADSIFAAKPRVGLVEPCHEQIVVVRHHPRLCTNYQVELPVRLNDMEKNNTTLRLVGSAEEPRVQLENEGNLYFNRTCIGLSTERLYGVKNLTRLPLHFEWKMKHSDKRHLSVYPKSGIIQPNEMQYQTWRFRPANEAKLVLKPCLQVWSSPQAESAAHIHGAEDQEPARYKAEVMLRVIAEGAVGGICTESNYLDLGTVVVGTQDSEELMLVNNNNCVLYYQLHLEQLVKGPYTDDEIRRDPLALTLDQVSGEIPPRGKAYVRVTVTPLRRVYYQWALSYKLTNEHGVPNPSLDSGPHHLCHILANGVFPSIAVTDARCYGSVVGLSKKQLWRLFNLDNLNVCLDSDPSPAELVYNLQTRHSHNRRPPVYTRAIMDFNFSGAPVDAEPSCVQLMLENTGNVECEWAFLMPRELELELEYWSESGEFTEEELHEMKVQDNHLFTISPSRGTLQPGEIIGVTFTYQHDSPGTDRLPVLLKVAQGREILLNFIGVTVDRDHPYIHFPMSKHLFTPVPIGSKNVATQLYEMFNGGGVPVEYQVDLAPLQQVIEESFDHKVFEVVNPSGVIQPGQTGFMQWKFDPLEAKTYMVDVPIHLANSDTAIITFTGVGYDRRLMGDTMPLMDQPHELAGVPSVQTLLLPKQLCIVVPERVTFGNVPLFTKNRRMTTLVNKSREHAVHFKWHLTATRDSKMISVAPSEGIIEPMEATMCRITMTALGTPAFFDIDLICEITNMTEYNEYKKELESWHTERIRQSLEFTIDEKNPEADQHLLDLDSARPPSRLVAVPSPKRSSPDLEELQSDAQIIRYKTLPPIKKCLMKNNETQMKRGKLRFKEEFWPCPEAPMPFLLHFGVTARSHTIADYQQNFEGEIKGYFIDRLLSERQSKMEAHNVIQQAKPFTCREKESDVIKSLMMVILRGLIDDTEFQESCSKVLSASIPYHAQHCNFSLPQGLRSGRPAIRDRKNTISPVPPPRRGSLEGKAEPKATVREVKDDQGSQNTSMNAGDDGASDTSSVSSVREQVITSTPKASAVSKGCKKRKEEMEDQSKMFQRKQTMRKLPEFGNMVDSVLENTLLNIMREAFHVEFNITSRPRQIALPPKKKSPRNQTILK